MWIRKAKKQQVHKEDARLGQKKKIRCLDRVCVCLWPLNMTSTTRIGWSLGVEWTRIRIRSNEKATKNRKKKIILTTFNILQEYTLKHNLLAFFFFWNFFVYLIGTSLSFESEAIRSAFEKMRISLLKWKKKERKKKRRMHSKPEIHVEGRIIAIYDCGHLYVYAI